MGSLLCWRHDNFYGPGWHVPGGVLRHKETLQERVKAVLISECGIDLGSLDIGDHIWCQNYSIRSDVYGDISFLCFTCSMNVKLLRMAGRFAVPTTDRVCSLYMSPRQYNLCAKEVYGQSSSKYVVPPECVQDLRMVNTLSGSTILFWVVLD